MKSNLYKALAIIIGWFVVAIITFGGTAFFQIELSNEFMYVYYILSLITWGFGIYFYWKDQQEWNATKKVNHEHSKS